jgi:hypothetical protein
LSAPRDKKAFSAFKIVNLNFAGEEFRAGKLRVTVGGDQLTRVRFDAARHLRSGSHLSLEKLEHLAPVVEEFFHIQQDLLEVHNYLCMILSLIVLSSQFLNDQCKFSCLP